MARFTEHWSTTRRSASRYFSGNEAGSSMRRSTAASVPSSAKVGRSTTRMPSVGISRFAQKKHD